MNNSRKTELLINLGPLTLPFGRTSEPGRSIEKGAAILFPSYNANHNGTPDDVVYYNDAEGIHNNKKESTYLWIISQNGDLLILLEQTPNKNSPRKHVCHTNITGGAEAYQGGELWFISDQKIIINRKSGRYGGNDSQEKYIIEYFELSGYEVSITP